METKGVTLPRTNLANENQSRNGSRPVSLYDNFQNYETPRSERHSVQPREIVFEGNPTQANFLNTTVPQNITGNNIAGRHTPTRNSLRHSRMIVMGRTRKVPRKSQPPILRFHKLAKALVGLQVLLGAGLCFLSLWLVLWTPNIRTRDNPFWSALPLLLSGIVGLVLLCCCRKEHPGMSQGYLIYSTKVLSIFLSTVAGTTCLIAATFALIHLISLTVMNCEPLHQLNATCMCRNDEGSNNTSLSIKSYHYVDLSCLEVQNILSILLIFSCGTNFIGGVLCLWYVYLHWISRYLYTYSKVRTNENQPVVISNS